MTNVLIVAAIFLLTALGAGCQMGAGTASNTNTSTANTAAKPTETKPEINTVPSEANVGSLATPSDAYKTAYELRKKKDVEGLKKVMSKDILEFFTEIGKEENKSLDDMLRELAEKPQADRAEVRNEKITGNTAILEYLDEKGNWKEMDFEKVDGKWLLSFPKAANANPSDPKP